MKEMTVNDLIRDLESLHSSLKDLPIKIQAENGLLFEPKVKVLLEKHQTMLDAPKKMIITAS
jgi:hypothetical protein